MADALSGLPALRQYAIDIAEKKQLEARLKAVAASIDNLSAAVLAHFENEGVRRVDFDDLDTCIFLRTEHWPSKTEACELLSNMEIRQRFLDADMGQFCEPRINVQGLRAHLDEQRKQAEARAKERGSNSLEVDADSVIPESLRGLIQLKTVHKVGARKR